MSKSVIDERVVQMSFDNDQFEKGVAQTINSLEKLDNGLDKISDGTYFQNMETSIKRVEEAFTASGMVINGILISIGQTINQYINKGLAALTSGIRGGMAEYETQMGATQTILANVKDEGKGIDDVTAALDELNTYADKTIYNFTEMTRNIGMFTAAGANLDTSVATIKGLANAAALVGANATTAARAWYQVSQAMAAGSFKLMDWRSLEISNIAGEGFKSVLTEVARKDGLAVAKMIDNGAALRDTLKDGWLTADRFAEAMRILSGDLDEAAMKSLGYTDEQVEKLKAIADEAVNAAIKVKSFGQLMETTAEAIGSGWAVTFRTLIGDFEKARTLFTRVSITLNSVIDKISDYRNHFLDFVWNSSNWGEASAYDNFKRALDNLLAIFSTFIGSLRAGFDNVFDWTDVRSSLGKFATNIRKFTNAFVINDSKAWTNYLENKEKVNKAIEEGLDPDEVVKHTLTESELANYWDLDAVNNNIKNLIRIFRGLFSGIDIVFTTIGETISWVVNLIPGMDKFFGNLKDGNENLLSNLADIMDKVTMIRDMIVDLDLVPNILNLIKKSIADIIKNNPLLMGMINGLIYAEKTIKAFFARLKEMNISPFNILIGALKMIGGVISGIFYGISEAISKIIEFFTGKTNFSFLDAIGKEIGTFIVILGELGKGTISVADVFEYYKQKVIGAFQAIYNSPFVQGIIGFFVKAWENIKNFWNNFKNVLDTIGSYLTNFYNDYFGDFEFNIKDLGLFGVLAAIGVLLYKFTKDVEGWASIGSRIADVLNAFANKVNSEALLNTAKAVGILAASIFVLSLIPYETLLDTVSMITVVMFMFIALFSVIKKTFDALEAVKKAIDPVEKIFLNLSVGIKKLAARTGTAMVLQSIGDAVLKIAAALIALGLAFQFMPDSMEKAIGVLIGIGVALAAIFAIIGIMSKSSVTKGVKGLVDITNVLNLSIASFLDALKTYINLAVIAILIEAFSDAVIKLSLALAIIASIDTNKLITSLLALLAIMGYMTIVIIGMGSLSSPLVFSQLIGFSLALVSFSGCVAVLSMVAALLGTLPFDVLGKGLLALSSIILVFGGIIAIVSATINPATASAFGALAAIFLALGAGIAAIIYTSSLIQNGYQIAALSIAMYSMLGLMGLVIALASTLKLAIVEAPVILSFAAIIGSLSLAFLSIGYTLSQIGNMQIDPSVLVALGIMIGAIVLITGIIGALAIAIGTISEVNTVIGVLADVAIVGLAASIAAWGLVAYAIGQLILNISQAVLNMEEALRGFYEILEFIATSADRFITVITGAAVGLLAAIPSTFALFVSIGVALGTAISGIILGLEAVIDGIVLNICTMILEIVLQITNWINSNSGLILNALSSLWDALLNLAAIALVLAVEKILPTLLSILVTLPVRLWGMVVKALGDLLKNSGIPVLEMFGETISVAGEAAIWLADTVVGAINQIITGLQALGIEIDSIGGASQGMTDSVSDSMLTIADAVNKATISITDDTTELVDVNAEATKQLEENSKKYSEVKKAEAKDFSIAEGTEVSAMAQAAAEKLGITDGNIADVTKLLENGWQLDLDNQDSFIESYLSGIDYMGEQDNNKTAGYLVKNQQLYSSYYGDLADVAKDYYDNQAAFSAAVVNGPKDQASLKKAQDDYLNSAKAAKQTLLDAGYTMQDILNDGIDWNITSKNTKQKQQAEFDSWTSMFDAMSNYASQYKAPEVDTSMYSPSFAGSGLTDTSALQNELKDRNDLINKADSEIQPKDLTPTIDLDSLKNEVNQANGIMTGSLLAAQNAAIGDYINTDSELNPFLKDRWQNVYNFTQNNYSPKALSRIDIYRQTQNQLRLSRGM